MAAPVQTVIDKLARGGLVYLDGGMGNELRRRKAHRNDEEFQKLWSASPLLHEDGQRHVKDAHASFVAAGAEVITTNTYACTEEILGKAGIDSELEKLVETACSLARAACKPETVLAGSLPPLSETYNHTLVKSDEVLYQQYQRIVDVLAPKVDIVLAESMTTIREAVVAATVAKKSGKPVWVAANLNEAGDCLRSGEKLDDYIEAMAPITDALVWNCSTPEASTNAIEIALKKIPGLKTGAYANHFHPVPEGWALEGPMQESGFLLKPRPELGTEEYAAHAQKWRDLGATIIGGCCGIAPEHIYAIRQSVV